MQNILWRKNSMYVWSCTYCYKSTCIGSSGVPVEALYITKNQLVDFLFLQDFCISRGAEQRQIWQIVLYCDRIRCYAAEMWQKLKCYACFILPKLIKNRLTDQWYWSRIGKVAAYSVKQQNSWKKIARKTLDVAT